MRLKGAANGRAFALAVIGTGRKRHKQWRFPQKGPGSRVMRHDRPSLCRGLASHPLWLPGFLSPTTEVAHAALIAALDLVIAVDISVAHLAAALGKPVWLMLPFAPDFRWLLEREDSPWYPGMRLFRQQRLGDWDGVIARISAALQP